jgi:hypothetical protein
MNTQTDAVNNTNNTNIGEAQMSNEKTYNVAGYSICGGKFKMRLAKDFDRVKTLIRTGHTEIEMFQLPSAMIKADAHNWLQVNQPRTYVAKEIVDKPYVVWTDIAADVIADIVATRQQAEELNTEVEVEQPTFEMILATIPLRENGRFVKKIVREEQARTKLAELLA